MDITSFMERFVNLFKDVFVEFFSMLRSIQFWGTNLMDFTLSVLVMSAVFPLLISVARNGSSEVGKVIRNSERGNKGRSSADDSK